MLKNQKNMLSIAVIQQTPDIGGAETYMLLLIAEFLKKGNNIRLASNLDKFLDQAPSAVKRYKIPFIIDVMGDWKGLIRTITRLPKAYIYYIKLLTSFKKGNVDIILMSGFSDKMLVTFLTLFIRIPVVWIEYGPLKPVFSRNLGLPYILYRLLYKIPYKIIVPSKNTLKSLQLDAHIESSHLIVISCGVEFKEKCDDISEVIKQYKGRFIIGNVSRLTREKGQEFLIHAAGLVQKHIPTVLFLLIGDGPDKKYYQDVIDKLSLNKTVLLLGFVPSLESYYEAMNIFVFPTMWDLEGFGVVLPEAMSHHVPIIAFDTGPVKEIVRKDVGVIVQAGNTSQLAHAIVSMATDSNRRRQLGDTAYRHAHNRYEIGKTSDMLLSVLSRAATR